jgi:hypothetical protein
VLIIGIVSVESSTMFNSVQQCVIKLFMLSKCNYSQYGVHYQYNISAYQSEIMTTKTKIGLFLMTGLVLAVAAIYSIPMQQQAMACGGGCHGGGKKSGGSLVNVENIGNVEDNNVKIGNVKTGHILSGNEILSKNYLKDVNVLSKNNVLNDLHSLVEVEHNNFLNDLHSLVEVEDFANNLHSLAEVEKNPVNTEILNSYYKEICGC